MIIRPIHNSGHFRSKYPPLCSDFWLIEKLQVSDCLHGLVQIQGPRLRLMIIMSQRFPVIYRSQIMKQSTKGLIQEPLIFFYIKQPKFALMVKVRGSSVEMFKIFVSAQTSHARLIKTPGARYEPLIKYQTACKWFKNSNLVLQVNKIENVFTMFFTK